VVESFIVIGAGILFLGFAGSRWTKFFTERYLSYLASVGVKLFVLYLIMGVGMGIASRWIPILERGGFSPIPFFYVMGGSLVFVFLTWHIPSVAGSMMAGPSAFLSPTRSIPRSWGAGRQGLVSSRRVLSVLRQSAEYDGASIGYEFTLLCIP
jgi:type IV secretion system protein TrbL